MIGGHLWFECRVVCLLDFSYITSPLFKLSAGRKQFQHSQHNENTSITSLFLNTLLDSLNHFGQNVLHLVQIQKGEKKENKTL